MARIVLDHLTKTFSRVIGQAIHAVNQVSLDIANGEFLALVGPSACGKTTLLRLIAGLEQPTMGQIHCDGQSITTLPPKERDVAMVFQNYALYPHLTVFQNLAFPLRLRKVPKGEIEKRVAEMAGLLYLQSCLEQYPRSLAGGERQRVAIGRALIRRPRICLLDEPFTHLDPPLRSQMRYELLQIHKHLAATMILVTHDQIEALTMGDRVAVMECGQIQQVASADTLIQRPANLFVAGFVGDPPMIFLRGHLVQQGTGIGFREEPAENRTSEQDWDFTLSPEQASQVTSYIGKAVILGLRLKDAPSLFRYASVAFSPLLTMKQRNPALNALARQSLRTPDQITLIVFFDPTTGKMIG